MLPIETVLAGRYGAMAESEHAQISQSQRDRLECLLVQDERFATVGGLFFEQLDAIHRELKTRGISTGQLHAEYFPDLDPSTVSKWFSDYSIKLMNYLRLVAIPFLQTISIRTEDLPFQEHRFAISWIKEDVLKEREGARGLKWIEYTFLVHVHKCGEQDLDAAFKKRPVTIEKDRRKGQDAIWLSRIMKSWGRSYRLFHWEKYRHV